MASASRALVGGIIGSHDENGIVWPEAVAPFDVGLINMRPGDASCDAVCEKLYAAMTAVYRDVLYDDTDDRAGAKFARMDLIGLPGRQRLARGVAEGKVEVKNRKSGEKHDVSIEDMLAQLKAS